MTDEKMKRAVEIKASIDCLGYMANDVKACAPFKRAPLSNLEPASREVIERSVKDAWALTELEEFKEKALAKIYAYAQQLQAEYEAL